jgi:hypothetical protein
MLNALADAVRALSKITGAGNIAVQKSPSGTVIMSSAVGLPPGMTGAVVWYNGTQWVTLAPPTDDSGNPLDCILGYSADANAVAWFTPPSVDSILGFDIITGRLVWSPIHDCSA